MLKVNSPQPPQQNIPADTQAPMDDMPPKAPMSEPDMNGGMSPDAFPSQDSGDDMFDADFDAGVDTDENEDPRNFIQQLAGKLSQSLRKYNETLPKPDADLNKYVAGMVNAQAVKGLSQEDVDTIIDRFKEDEANDGDDMMSMEDHSQGQNPDEQIPDNSQQPPQGPPQEGGMPPQRPQRANGQQPAMESFQRQQSIDELFQDLTISKDDEGCPEKEKSAQKTRYRLKPFTSPIFK